ncbi:MAG: hypothetical protein KKA79_10720, partial [Nanoarchaeota archaeon]|nr:hypothetical protein [Nanoarchaeota archaeon]
MKLPKSFRIEKNLDDTIQRLKDGKVKKIHDEQGWIEPLEVFTSLIGGFGDFNFNACDPRFSPDRTFPETITAYSYVGDTKLRSFSMIGNYYVERGHFPKYVQGSMDNEGY